MIEVKLYTLKNRPAHKTGLNEVKAMEQMESVPGITIAGECRFNQDITEEN